ncbi:glycosyltransferase family 2 protein [Prosthecobacter dejongeii]|uniref:Cellulose synthase (UDP-forming) n=1 Tax=Prosthecobacter dejongeii TaxID=48465 RepID=A0A7W7YMR9_9BACT|nr:cellulose synthase catalytic subunit [Prosthecobacter dejongeii]MBB5039076.1 cellulose synthase (UDP-forming) [Prosthecobacter dejongeii]
MFSHSREVVTYLSQKRLRVRLAGAAYALVALPYLVWRFTVFNENALVMSWIFYLAEFYGIVLGLTLIYSAWQQRERVIPKITRPFTVDVMVPVYTEPAEMIDLTVLGAKEIAYPHETWLLDDGRRPEIEAIAKKYGVHYVTRADNRGAKAGNLNNAMKLSRGEVIAVFDSDHIAQREALEKLLPFLEDEKVGLVQAPQCYYNEDSFLYRENYVGGGRWHEQAFFMDVMQRSHDTYDACTGIGTGVLYRRSALDLIGGFPEQTITEDIHTSLLMHKNGLKTAYVNEPVAWGVAASDVSEFSKTRRRWAHGNLHVFFVENILFCRGLPWRKRLAYLMMGLHMQEGWQQLAFLLLPAYSMIFYVTPFDPSLFNTLIIMGLPPLMVLLLMVTGAGYLPFLPTQIFTTGKLFPQLIATRGLVGKSLGWQVSLKNVLGRVSFSMLAPHFVILTIGSLALVYALLRVTGWIPMLTPPVGGQIILSFACFWVVFNLWRSWRWIRDTIGLTLRTHREYQFEAKLPVLDEDNHWLGVTERLSTTEAEVTWIKEGAQCVGQRLRLVSPGYVIAVTVHKAHSGGGMTFECEDEDGLDRLRRGLYSVDWHRKLRLAQWASEAYRQGLGGLWQAVLLCHGVERVWAMLLPGREPQSATLLVTTLLQMGQEIEIQVLNSGEINTQRWTIREEIRPEFLMPRGLNDQNFAFLKIDR